MNFFYFIGTLVLPCLAALGLGFVWGKGRGEDAGYELGYREGAFDVANGACCAGDVHGDHAKDCKSWPQSA